MVNHKPAYIVLILITWMFLLAVFFLNFLSGYDAQNLGWGIFINTTGGVSDQYSIEITPSGWTFSIWGVIYFWQALWMIYALTTICRKDERGYLYYSPPFMHWTIYVFYILNLCCNIAWLFLWDRGLFHLAFPVLAFLVITLDICIGISIYGINKYYLDLVRCGHGNEPWYVIAFVHNGLGVYAAWTTVATLLNMAIFLAYSIGLPQDVSSAIALGSLAFILVMYMMLDLVLLERYMRFLMTPYLVVIIALIGSLDKNWNPTKPNSMFTVGLLAIVTVGFVVKISVIIWKQRVDPVFSVGKKRAEMA